VTDKTKGVVDGDHFSLPVRQEIPGGSRLCGKAGIMRPLPSQNRGSKRKRGRRRRDRAHACVILALDQPDRAKSTGVPLRDNSIMCFSGFVMQSFESWFLVTAGHILANIDTVVRSGQEGILQSRVIDFFGPKATHRTLVPMQYADTDKYYEYDKASGTDFGFIHLRPLICANLIQNHVIPVDRRMWANECTPDFEGYFMIGLPTELMKHQTKARKPGDEASIDLRVAMIPVHKLDDVPADLSSHSEPLFAGIIPPEESGVVDIDGMSGGPVIGVRKLPDGSAIYAVVAVQSAWYRSRRIILAYPFPPLARRMELEIRKLRPDLAGTDTSE
jgi:hypothetical protein